MNASVSFISILKFEKNIQLILIVHKFHLCKFTYLLNLFGFPIITSSAFVQACKSGGKSELHMFPTEVE